MIGNSYLRVSTKIHDASLDIDKVLAIAFTSNIAISDVETFINNHESYCTPLFDPITGKGSMSYPASIEGVSMIGFINDVVDDHTTPTIVSVDENTSYYVWIYTRNGAGFTTLTYMEPPLTLIPSYLTYDPRSSDSIDGTTLIDSSGNARNASIEYGLVLQDNNSFVFDGSNHVKLLNLGNPSGKWEHTISYWLYMYEYLPTVKFTPFFIGTPSANRTSSFDFWTNGTVNWYFYSNDAKFTPTLSANTWYHMCFVYDTTTNQRHLYVNGTLAETIASSEDLNLYANTSLYLGKDVPRNQNPFTGKLGVVSIFDTALNSTEVLSLFHSQMNSYL